jgi:hypothetical protein
MQCSPACRALRPGGSPVHFKPHPCHARVLQVPHRGRRGALVQQTCYHGPCRLRRVAEGRAVTDDPGATWGYWVRGLTPWSPAVGLAHSLICPGPDTSLTAPGRDVLGWVAIDGGPSVCLAPADGYRRRMGSVGVGLVADPAAPTEIARGLTDLRPVDGGGVWDITVVSEPLSLGARKHSQRSGCASRGSGPAEASGSSSLACTAVTASCRNRPRPTRACRAGRGLFSVVVGATGSLGVLG